MNHDKILVLNEAYAQIPLLAIIPTRVGNFEHRALKDKRCNTKIDAMLVDIRLPLVLVPLVFHSELRLA